MEEVGSQSVPPSGKSENLLFVLLGLFVAAPALAILVGFDGGKLVFFLYREPKLIVMMILGWILLATALWIIGARLSWSALRDVLRRQPVVWLAGFLAYSWLSLCWSVVPQNSIYELQQYSMLFMVLLLLMMWDRVDGRVRSVVIVSVVVSLGCLVAIGLFQAFGILRVIEPIDPSGLVSFPSLMGYKNPMAMATLGQLFLVAGMAAAAVSRRRWKTSAALSLLLVTELVFMIALQSRTALLGLAAGLLWLLVLSLARRGILRTAAPGLFGILAVFLLVVLVAAVNPMVERKARSVLGFATEPRSFLDSDRGTYLINTLNMVRHNPLGVGVGDWQTHYPLYRVKNRYLWFDEQYQVRRAHSDHVQLLGEVGWPGFILWAGILLSLVWRTSRNWLQGKEPLAFFLSAQLLAFIAAMGTDYVIEHPYGKLQFFLLVFLCLSNQGVVRHAQPGRVTDQGFRVAFAVLCTVVALLNCLYYVQLARKTLLAAHLTRSYLRALPSQVISEKRNQRAIGPDQPVRLLKVLDDGRSFIRLPGHTKTMFRDYLLVADTFRRLGDVPRAEANLRRSLILHPHHPPALRLMAHMKRKPEESKEWVLAYDFVMNTATEGYDRPYPPGHPLRRNRVR